MTAVLSRAVLSGMPVVDVGRGDAQGTVPNVRGSLFVAGSTLTATDARLLMACLLRFGSPPPAADPTAPTPDELASALAHLAKLEGPFSQPVRRGAEARRIRSSPRARHAPGRRPRRRCPCRRHRFVVTVEI